MARPRITRRKHWQPEHEQKLGSPRIFGLSGAFQDVLVRHKIRNPGGIVRAKPGRRISALRRTECRAGHRAHPLLPGIALSCRNLVAAGPGRTLKRSDRIIRFLEQAQAPAEDTRSARLRSLRDSVDGACSVQDFSGLSPSPAHGTNQHLPAQDIPALDGGLDDWQWRLI